MSDATDPLFRPGLLPEPNPHLGADFLKSCDCSYVPAPGTIYAVLFIDVSVLFPVPIE